MREQLLNAWAHESLTTGQEAGGKRKTPVVSCLRRTNSRMRPKPLVGLKIVLVEDHGPLLRQLGSFLEQSGANVVLAENGVQGLRAIRNNRPYVVISDILTGGVDGFELLRQIRELGPNEGGSAVNSA